MTIAVGTALQNGKYSLQRELGQGGFGITYLAHHHDLDQRVVIKTINDQLRQDPDFSKFQHQFREEAQRLAKFSHPSIVRVSDFFVEDGLPFIVMDFIAGQTLKEVVSPQPLSEATAIHYIRQVGAALSIVHAHGLLHRDIKPQNILLRHGTHDVVLIDFGIAREFTPGMVQTHTGVLSAGYAPIEQYMPRAKRTPATDVYGLAATLYTLLTAEVPVAALLRHRQTLPAPRNLQPAISAQLNEAVMRGMAIEAEHRPQTIEAWLSLFPDQPLSSPLGVSPTQSTLSLSSPIVAPVQVLVQVPVQAAVAAPTTWATAVPQPSPSNQPLAPILSPKLTRRRGMVTGFVALVGLLVLGNGLLALTSSESKSPNVEFSPSESETSGLELSPSEPTSEPDRLPAAQPPEEPQTPQSPIESSPPAEAVPPSRESTYESTGYESSGYESIGGEPSESISPTSSPTSISPTVEEPAETGNEPLLRQVEVVLPRDLPLSPPLEPSEIEGVLRDIQGASRRDRRGEDEDEGEDD